MVTQEELEKMSPEEIAKLQKDNCIFCKIISGEIPSKVVYEDDYVIAILDINPAKKGHVLVMPKEHFPILPLIPPQIFEKIFLATKLIAQGIRKAMLVKETTIFIANGAVAGQQSPHFLFHIFPRDEGDILTNFNLEENLSIKVEQQSLEASLKNNLNTMLSKIVAPINLSSDSVNQNISSTPVSKNVVLDSDALAKKHELIAQIIEEHADVRDALLENPINFKEQLKGNPQLEKLFEGIDLETLSSQLKPSFEKPNLKEEEKTEIKKVEEIPKEELSTKRPEVFSGADPIAQRKAVFDYLNSKPKAKELLLADPKYFQELLDKRPDVQDLFVDVNVELLSKKLKEKEVSSNE